MITPETCPFLMERKMNEVDQVCHYGEAFSVVMIIAGVQVLVLLVVLTVYIRVKLNQSKQPEEDNAKLIPTPKGPSYEGL